MKHSPPCSNYTVTSSIISSQGKNDTRVRTHTHTYADTSDSTIAHLLLGGAFILFPLPPPLRFLCLPPVRVSSRSVVSGRDGGRDASREVGAAPDFYAGTPSPTWSTSGLSTEPRIIPLLLWPLPPRTVGGGSAGEEGAASASSGRLLV